MRNVDMLTPSEFPPSLILRGYGSQCEEERSRGNSVAVEIVVRSATPFFMKYWGLVNVPSLLLGSSVALGLRCI